MERLEDKRIWLFGGAIAAVLIIIASWFLFISPELSSASDLRSQAANTRQENATLQAKVASLRAKSSNLSKYQASLRAALLALPYSSGLPAFTRQLDAQAADAKVTMKSINVGAIAAATPGGTTTPVTTTPADGTTTSTAPASTGGTTSATAATSASGGLFAIQVTVQSVGSLAHQEQFLGSIRADGPRRVLINSTQLSQSGTKSIDSQVSITTQLTVFSVARTSAEVTQLKSLLSSKIGN